MDKDIRKKARKLVKEIDKMNGVKDCFTDLKIDAVEELLKAAWNDGWNHGHRGDYEDE